MDTTNKIPKEIKDKIPCMATLIKEIMKKHGCSQKKAHFWAVEERDRIIKYHTERLNNGVNYGK